MPERPLVQPVLINAEVTATAVVITAEDANPEEQENN
jgi:hypothetical protein